MTPEDALRALSRIEQIEEKLDAAREDMARQERRITEIWRRTLWMAGAVAFLCVGALAGLALGGFAGGEAFGVITLLVGAGGLLWLRHTYRSSGQD